MKNKDRSASPRREWGKPTGISRLFQREFSGPYNPLVFFGCFFLALGLLSYSSWGLFPKIWIALIGFFLPFVYALGAGFSKPSPKFDWPSIEIFRPVPFGGLVLVLGLALFLRFWNITGLFLWPTSDEGTSGLLAVDLSRHWNWNFFHGLGQYPPLLPWMNGLLFRWTQAPFLSLWFPSAFLSSLEVLLAYRALNYFFSKSFSWIAVCLLAFSYWPLYSGRYGNVEIVLFWELGSLFLLGWFLQQTSDSGRKMGAALLGLGLGLGSFTYTQWPIVVLGIGSAAFWKGKTRRPLSGVEKGLLLFGFLAASSPFWLAVASGGYGHHILAVASWNESHWERTLLLFCGCFKMLFVGSGARLDDPYDPWLGGLLNPLLGSVFWVGVLEAAARIRKREAAWLLLVFFLFLSPGFLASPVSNFRMIQVLPIVLAIAAWGWSACLSQLKSSWRIWVFLGGMALSLGLDGYRLVQPYWNAPDRAERLSRVARAYEKFRAYQIVDEFHRQLGPGFVFSDFVPEKGDETLAFVTYPFNGAWNPAVSSGDMHWAALLTNRHYLPFLSKRFPQAQWRFLPTSVTGRWSNHILGMIPVTAQTRPLFQEWSKVNAAWMEINMRVNDMADGKSWRGILEKLIELYPALPQDPFLQSCFLEKLIYYYSLEKTFHPEDRWNEFSSYSQVVHEAVPRSYPDPVLEEKIGDWMAVEGQEGQARGMFQKALRLDPANGNLKEKIRKTQEMEKGRGGGGAGPGMVPSRAEGRL